MRFSCRTEILLDANMDLHIATGKPYTAMPGQQRRFGDLLHSQKLTIETPCCIFAARRSRELDMIKGEKRYRTHSCYASA